MDPSAPATVKISFANDNIELQVSQQITSGLAVIFSTSFQIVSSLSKVEFFASSLSRCGSEKGALFAIQKENLVAAQTKDK